MDTYDSRGYFPSRDVGTIIPQLNIAAATMQHVDELFQQLAWAIVDRLNVQLVQFWTNHVNQAGQSSLRLCTLARQDSSLPEYIVVNDQIAKIASHIVNEQHSYNLQHVEAMFPPYHSSLLKRYGLNYCISYFVARNALLPSNRSVSPQEESPVLFAMTAWLFLRQSPPQKLPPAIATILQQAVTVAENNSLLLPAGTKTSRSSGDFLAAQRQKALPTPKELVPHRKQNANLSLSSNPFNSSPIIADKKARRLHAAIDGHATVEDICQTIGMDREEALAALRMLLAQDLIELYTPAGQFVDALLLFNNQ